MNDEERELVARAKARDRGAFATLLDRYRGRVYALAVSIAGDHAAAVELTREAFVRAWRELPALERLDRFPSWLSAIAYKAGGEHPKDPGTGSAPTEPQIESDERAALDQVLATLPEAQRVAIDLRFREGLGYMEIGETLDMAPLAVRATLAKATQGLRERLAPLLRGGAKPP